MQGGPPENGGSAYRPVIIAGRLAPGKGQAGTRHARGRQGREMGKRRGVFRGAERVALPPCPGYLS